MKKRRTIWQWLKDWWTPDDEEDADGYPGDVCPFCYGVGTVIVVVRGRQARCQCPSCKGKGTV